MKKIHLNYNLLGHFKELAFKNKLKQLLDEGAGNNVVNHKKRLRNAYKSLKNKNKKINMKSLLNEAKMDEGTVRRHEELIELIKNLVNS